MKALVLPIVVLAATCTAHGQSVVLRYKFVPGTNRAYKMSMDGDIKTDLGKGKAMPMKTVMSMDIKNTVQSVAKDGTGTLVWTVSNMTNSVNGRSVAPKSKPDQTTMKMTPLGKVLNMKNPGLAAMGMGGNPMEGMQMTAALPQGPVHVGSKWSTQMNFGGTSTTVQNTLEQITTVRGHRVANIRTTGTIDVAKLMAAVFKNGAPGGMQSSGTIGLNSRYGFDIDGGVVRTMSGVINMKMNMKGSGQQGGPPMNIMTSGTEKISMNLVGG